MNRMRYNNIKKALTKAFKTVPRPSFAIQGKNLCSECEIRHAKLQDGHDVTIDDMAMSCYSSMFYEPNTFEYLIPMQFINAMNKKSNAHDTFPDLFLRELRDENKRIYYQYYSKDKKDAIVQALLFLRDLYHMESYEVWDFEREQLVCYHKEEQIAMEIKRTLDFWQDLNPASD